MVTPLLSDLPIVLSPSDPLFTPNLNDFDVFFLLRPGRGIGKESKLNLNLFIPLELDGTDKLESISSNLHHPLYIRLRDAYANNSAFAHPKLKKWNITKEKKWKQNRSLAPDLKVTNPNILYNGTKEII